MVAKSLLAWQVIAGTLPPMTVRCGLLSSGSVYAKDVKPGMVTTVNGARFTVCADGGSIYLIDDKGNKAKIVMTDIAESNGVIHVINAVLEDGQQTTCRGARSRADRAPLCPGMEWRSRWRANCAEATGRRSSPI